MSIGRDASFSLAAAIAPVVCLLVTTPLYLSAIGPERFGLLAICWTLLAATNFTSLGMGPALTYRLALLTGDADEERSRIAWMAIAVAMIAASILALAVIAIGAPLFERNASLHSTLKAETFQAIPLLGVMLPVGALSGVFNGALQGRGRFGLLSLFTMSNALAITIMPLGWVQHFDPSMPSLLGAVLVASLLVVILQAIFCARVIPLTAGGRPQRRDYQALVGFGAWMTGTSIVAPLMLMADRFVVGSVIGPAAVTVYVLALNIVQGVILIPASLSKAMMTRLIALDSDEGVKEFQTAFVRWLATLLTLGTIAALALAGPFLTVWVGRDLARQATPVAIILLLGGWLHGIGHIPSTVVVARKRPDLLTKQLLACLPPYALLLYIGTATFGVIGAAASWSIRALADVALFVFTSPSRQGIQYLCGSALFVLAAAIAVSTSGWTSIQYWIGSGVVFVGACIFHLSVISGAVSILRASRPPAAPEKAK